MKNYRDTETEVKIIISILKMKFFFWFYLTLEMCTTIVDVLTSTITIFQGIIIIFDLVSFIMDHTINALISLRIDISLENLQENVPIML